MRKVLLVLALIGASFAGGALVNGPGLQWLKAMIGDRMHRSDTIPTLDMVNGTPVTAGPSPAEPEPQNPPLAEPQPLDVPSAPSPILGGALTPKPPASNTPETLIPQPPAEPPPPLAEVPAGPSPPPMPPAMAAKEPAPAPAEAPKTGWEDAPGLAPSMAVLPKPVKGVGPETDTAVSTATVDPAEPPPLPDSPPAQPPAPAGWSSLRARMKALGVSRFWIEGTPAGAVTFRCVVPADNSDAANRQFEAEDEDEFKAADSALRRVAVWKAAERVAKSR